VIGPGEKRSIVAAVVERLSEMKRTAERSAEAARDGMQVGGERTRNRGERAQFLESTYLLSAQVRQAEELQLLISRLGQMDLSASETVREGSLVEVSEADGRPETWYFLAHGGMGIAVDAGSRPVHVLSPGSPLGRALLGQRAGAAVEVRLSAGTRTLHIQWIA